MELRGYQDNGIRLVRESLRRGNKRVVLYSPTGSGKSAMAMAVIKMAREKGKRIGFLVNRKKLVHQFSLSLDREKIKHGVMQGENTWGLDKPVIVGTIQTVARRGFHDMDIVLIDESHGVPGSKDYRDFVFEYQAKPIIGLTATPFAKGMAMPHQELGGEALFQDLIIVATIKELIAQGYLVDCDIFSPSEPDLRGVGSQKNAFGEMDYNEKQVGVAVDKPDLIGDIVQTWIRLANGRPTVLFAANISHSKHLVAKFQEFGVKAEHIDGYMDDRESDPIAKRFEKGETTVISNVAVLREGWDVPACEVMILARPTRSLTAWIQMAGRILRPAPGKEKALILDHSGSALRLGYPTSDLPLFLCDGEAKEAKKPQEKGEEPKKETKCPVCHYIKRALVCGHCGHAPTIEHGVKHADGELKKLEKKKSFSAPEKQEIWSSALGLAVEKGKSRGWASHLYKSMVGVWPKGLNDTVCTPIDRVEKMAKHNAIAFAKSKVKHIGASR